MWIEQRGMVVNLEYVTVFFKLKDTAIRFIYSDKTDCTTFTFDSQTERDHAYDIISKSIGEKIVKVT